MKHRKLFIKLTIFCMVVIASLVGAYFSQTIELISLFIFTTGFGMGAVAVYLGEIIKKTKV